MSNAPTSTAKKFPWISTGIVILLGFVFLGFFYLAVSNEPDYMPSQQKKKAAEAEIAMPASHGNMSAEEHAKLEAAEQHTAPTSHAGH
ncbi:hypothetical protein [Acinetobacter sp. GSS19]|uniref:hypothetical protein n=1 Tax=Acinetobacter sp. GSS19 TaxID=3020716 RepID=UPI00235FE4FA|nr:hypothetical protein [Acinetobacter sp. GSS19]